MIRKQRSTIVTLIETELAAMRIVTGISGWMARVAICTAVLAMVGLYGDPARTATIENNSNAAGFVS